MNATLSRLANECVVNKKHYALNEIIEYVRTAKANGAHISNLRTAAQEVKELIQCQLKVRSMRKQSPAQPLLSLNERIAERTRQEIERIIRPLYRSRPSGDYSIEMSVGYPIATAQIFEGERYSRRCRYRKTDVVHRVCVPLTWLIRVKARNLAVCDGLFTLDAKQVPGQGPQLYEAMWIEQGRGFAIHIIHGYIARQDETTYHANTAKAAIVGLARKTNQLPERRKIDLDRIVKRYGELVVTLDDSISVGNCETGTRNWARTIGIENDEATITRILQGYQIRPMKEVLTVLRHVIRQHREWEKLLSSPPNVKFDNEGGFTTEVETCE